jgi:4'-phosphopantetheinyl transferase
MTAPIGSPAGRAIHWEQAPVEHYQTGTGVHVWRVSLRQSAQELRAAVAVLSDQEHVRARRFRQAADRDRYIAAHGAVRTILGRYLNEVPAQIRFVTGAQGKPDLAPEFQSSRLRFNLSHSGDWALVAVAGGREVGVDVEQFRSLPEAAPIAERTFAPEELAALADLATDKRPAVFFHIWACKEAFIKATGLGLSYPLRDFSVPLRPMTTRPVPIHAGGSRQWGLMRLVPGTHYAGAVVAEGLDWDVRLLQF